MYLIKIDTTERYNKSIVIFDQNTQAQVDEVKGDIDVSAELQKLLTKNNIAVNEIAEIIANPGPGSFTGIKTGITIANTINWALGRKTLEDLQKPEYGKEPNVQLPQGGRESQQK